jgi:hypothetical protein
MVAFLNVGCRNPGRSLRPIPPTDRPADPRKFVFQNSVGRLARARLVEAPRNRYAPSANYWLRYRPRALDIYSDGPTASCGPLWL